MSVLEIDRVSRSFGGNRAVVDVSFALAVDTLAIVGPNGAGKTTLLNLIAGCLHPQAGAIRFEGQEITRLPPWRIARLGMVKTYQVVRPFRTLSVEENLDLFGRLRGDADIEGILAATGLAGVRSSPAGTLPFGLLKRLELAKGLAARPTVLLLDEPIGGLSRAEAEGLVASLAELKRSGVRMVVVEHRLSEILPIVDRVVALDRGRLIFHGTRSEFFEDPAVRTAYLGSDHAAG
jgi:ABC-type branched-subunit amino acid transport system ATPase component